MREPTQKGEKLKMEKLTVEVRKDVYDTLFYIAKVLSEAQFVKSGKKDPNLRKVVAQMLSVGINGEDFMAIIKPLKLLAENTERMLKVNGENDGKKDA